MDHVTAQRVLCLDEDETLADAERKFAVRSAGIEAALVSLVPETPEHAALAGYATDLRAAIEYLRAPSTTVERAAAMLAASEAVVEQEQEQEREKGEPSGLESTARNSWASILIRAKAPFARLAGTLSSAWSGLAPDAPSLARPVAVLSAAVVVAIVTVAVVRDRGAQSPLPRDVPDAAPTIARVVGDEPLAGLESERAVREARDVSDSGAGADHIDGARLQQAGPAPNHADESSMQEASQAIVQDGVAEGLQPADFGVFQPLTVEAAAMPVADVAVLAASGAGLPDLSATVTASAPEPVPVGEAALPATLAVAQEAELAAPPGAGISIVEADIPPAAQPSAVAADTVADAGVTPTAADEPVESQAITDEAVTHEASAVLAAELPASAAVATGDALPEPQVVETLPAKPEPDSGPGDPATDIDARASELYALGQAAIARNRLSVPTGASARHYLGQIQALAAGLPEARALSGEIQHAYLVLVEEALAEEKLTAAGRYLDLAAQSDGAEARIDTLRSQLTRRREQRFQPLLAVEEVDGIAMVALPVGEFTMGAPRKSLERYSRRQNGFLGGLFAGGAASDTDWSGRDLEAPAHPVRLAGPVALSRSEITVEQFRRFVDATGYRTDAEAQGATHLYLDDKLVRLSGKTWRHDFLGRAAAPELPVVHVSHRDAEAFAQWLSEQTGARYRLPSESEYEYAARAGLTGLAPWAGKGPPPASENFRGEYDPLPRGWQLASEDQRVRTLGDYRDGAFGPAVAGTYPPNSFGLESLLGNVSEWTADCFSGSHEGKGGSSGPRLDGNCDQRVVRGADWATDARRLRLTYRRAQASDYSSNRIGFRVAREVLHGGDESLLTTAQVVD